MTPKPAIDVTRYSSIPYEIGAIRLSSRRYGEVWVVLDPRVVSVLKNEEAGNGRNRPVIFLEDVEHLRIKSERAVRAVLEICRVFPGSRVLH